MEEYCKNHLIKQQTSDEYTPQQNGLAEQFNRTILESMQTILQDLGLKKGYWNEIDKASLLTLNQIPVHQSKKSPFNLSYSETKPCHSVIFMQLVIVSLISLNQQNPTLN
jgi:transposase InsO family protein